MVNCAILEALNRPPKPRMESLLKVWNTIMNMKKACVRLYGWPILTQFSTYDFPTELYITV